MWIKSLVPLLLSLVLFGDPAIACDLFGTWLQKGELKDDYIPAFGEPGGTEGTCREGRLVVSKLDQTLRIYLTANCTHRYFGGDETFEKSLRRTEELAVVGQEIFLDRVLAGRLEKGEVHKIDASIRDGDGWTRSFELSCEKGVATLLDKESDDGDRELIKGDFFRENP